MVSKSDIIYQLKKYKYIISLSIILMIAASVFHNYLLSLAGFTTLSLSKATFTSSTKYFNGPTWILTVVQGGLGQHAYGTISKNDIGEKSGEYPEHDLSISIDYASFSYEYPISYLTQADLYKWGRKTWFCLYPPSQQDIINHCGKHTFLYGGKIQYSFTCVCYYADPVAKVASIDNCNFHVRAKIGVSAKGESYSAWIDSKNKTQTYVGPYVYVTWLGNLVRSNCPALWENYIAYYYNGWKVGYKNYYTQYVDDNNYLVNLIESHVNSNFDGSIDKQIQNMITKVDDDVSTITSNPVLPYTNNIEYMNGKPYIVLFADNAQAPMYTFYVKASWLGIYQPSPKPKIIYAEGSTFSSGSYGYLFAEVQNSGNESGTITVSAQCEPPVYVIDNAKQLYLKPGQVGSVSLRVDANVNQETTAQCTIYARTVGAEDSKTVSVTVKPGFVCNDGQTMCVDNKVMVCEGGQWKVYQVCAYDEYCGYEFGSAKCISYTNNNPVSNVGQNPLVNWLAEFIIHNWLEILGVAFLIFIAIKLVK